jgi:hypothetical protein
MDVWSAPLNALSTFIRAVLKPPAGVLTAVTVPKNTSSLWPTAWHGGGGATQLHAIARIEKLMKTENKAKLLNLVAISCIRRPIL